MYGRSFQGMGEYHILFQGHQLLVKECHGSPTLLFDFEEFAEGLGSRIQAHRVDVLVLAQMVPQLHGCVGPISTYPEMNSRNILNFQVV